jgi:UDP-3-O-[3-hydroxymyristoyl] glucosamine N-acyltransferase LpxD
MIHPTACVEGKIGAGTIVGAHAWIGSLVTIGRNCIIGPGCQLGQDGFGYTQLADGSWSRKPQSHGVVIEDDVHLGANVCVDRGSWRDTRIQSGSRIDNLCHIAHNVVIGHDCVVIAQSMLAGSVELKDGAYIAPCVSVREHRTIGAGAFVGLGAVVTRDVEDREHVRGVPAKTFEPRPTDKPAGAA